MDGWRMIEFMDQWRNKWKVRVSEQDRWMDV